MSVCFIRASLINSRISRSINPHISRWINPRICRWINTRTFYPNVFGSALTRGSFSVVRFAAARPMRARARVKAAHEIVWCVHACACVCMRVHACVCKSESESISIDRRDVNR